MKTYSAFLQRVVPNAGLRSSFTVTVQAVSSDMARVTAEAYSPALSVDEYAGFIGRLLGCDIAPVLHLSEELSSLTCGYCTSRLGDAPAAEDESR